MKLSIVTTLYQSAPYLREFHRRMTRAAEQITSDYELIFVNDGSPDDSQAIAEDLCEQDTRVVVVELSRNFGQHKAIMTGLNEARGEIVFLLDSDLEEPPEWLLLFDRLMQENQVDVVYGVQQTRKGNFFERWTGSLFYRLFQFLSECPVPPNLVASRLMRREYVRALVAHRDQEVFLAGLWVLTGFRQLGTIVQKKSKGTSSYSFRRRMQIAINAVTSFSTQPLRAVLYLGTLILLVSGLACLGLLIRRLSGEVLSGWTSLIISIWFLGGLTLFAQGILGLYLGKVFSEVKRRPYTVIRQIVGRGVGDVIPLDTPRRAKAA